MKKKTLFLAQAAIIAAAYVVLTLFSAALGLSSGPVQLRLSEALCVLPIFTAAAIPGLAIGCLLANILTGCIVYDVIFGTFATLIGAVIAYFIRRWKYLVPVPTILANTIIVPFILSNAYHIEGSIPYFMLTVGIGEVLSCGVIGYILMKTLEKNAKKLFK